MKDDKQDSKDFQEFLDLCKEAGAFPAGRIDDAFKEYQENKDCDLLCPVKLLLQLRRDYEKTGNPIHAWHAFRLSHRATYDPPFWVRSWLYTAFEKFEQSDGTVSLQELLGFTSKKRSGSLFKKIAEGERNNDLVFNIIILKKIYNVPLKIAFHIVYENQFIPRYNQRKIDLPELSTDSIITLYNNSPYRKKMRNDDFSALVDDAGKFKMFIQSYLCSAINVCNRRDGDTIITHNDLIKILLPHAKVYLPFLNKAKLIEAVENIIDHYSHYQQKNFKPLF